MDDYRPSFRGPGDRRLEIVSGKGSNPNGKPRSPDTKPSEAAPKTNQVASSSSKSWKLNDPEMKRKKRIVKYKAYSIEGKVKASIKKSFRWIKNKCNKIIHGY